MLKISAEEYRLCPKCGQVLNELEKGGGKRRGCLGCGWVYYPRVAMAAAGVAVRDRKVLLVKRARDPYKGYWMFPAGFVEFGEHPQETVAREMVEETGYTVTRSRLMDVLQASDDPREPGHLVFFYQVELQDGAKPTDMTENTQVEWIGLKQVTKIGWWAHQQIISRMSQE